MMARRLLGGAGASVEGDCVPAVTVTVNLLSGFQTTLEMAPSSLACDLLKTTLSIYLKRQPLQEELASWSLVSDTSAEEKKVMSDEPSGDIAPSDFSIVKMTDPLWKYADGNICRFTMMNAGDPEWRWEDRWAGGKLENVNGDTPMSEVLRQLVRLYGEDNFSGLQDFASRQEQRPILTRGELADAKLRSFVELGWCIYIKDVENENDYFTFTVRPSRQLRPSTPSDSSFES